MLNLREFRSHAHRLADWLPWACLVAPGIVLNKDGSFQRTVRYRGPDLDSATEAELMSAASRVNNVLKRFGSGWALFFDATRMTASEYPRSQFPDALSWLVDEERRASFEGTVDPAWDDPSRQGGQHFESISHLTFMYLPPVERVSRLEALFLENPGEGTSSSNPLSGLFRRKTAPRAQGMGDANLTENDGSVDDPPERDTGAGRAGAYQEQLQRFIQETDRAVDLLSSVLPEIAPLDDQDTLT
jgi:type IV secretion system protein TrbE